MSISRKLAEKPLNAIQKIGIFTRSLIGWEGQDTNVGESRIFHAMHLAKYSREEHYNRFQRD